MERTKLTIRVDADVLARAKEHAKESGTTLTGLVSSFLERTAAVSDPLKDAPVVRRLSGILPADASVEDHHRHLDHKYGA